MRPRSRSSVCTLSTAVCNVHGSVPEQLWEPFDGFPSLLASLVTLRRGSANSCSKGGGGEGGGGEGGGGEGGGEGGGGVGGVEGGDDGGCCGGGGEGEGLK